jgi:16S rRNA processing protein RimM
MGRIAGAYGVRGWVRVDPHSEDRHALLAQGTWWLQAHEGAAWRRVVVREARAHGGGLVASVDGIDSREAAAALRGAQVGVTRAALPPLASGELYWADLEGLAVRNRDDVLLGHIAGLLDTGAHPVLRIRPPAGPERLIPWVPAYIDEADMDARVVRVDWPADE